MLENCKIRKVLTNALVEDKNILPKVLMEGRGEGLFNNAKKCRIGILGLTY